jgi:glycosyltransferase involved in cell wall biosynthesis
MNVSIVIPAHNEEVLIANCLKSVCNQTIPSKEYEIIVVNNASADRTKQIAQRFNVKIIDVQKKGYVCALRAGCEMAREDIIAITYADTIVPRDWIEKIRKAYADPDVVAVGGGTILKPEFFSARVVQIGLNAVGQMFHYLPGYNFSVRRDVYEASGGFRPDINFSTDTEFCQRLKKYGKTAFIKNSPVFTSSRHYKGINGLKYCLKGLTNALAIYFLDKTIFFDFGDIR